MSMDDAAITTLINRINSAISATRGDDTVFAVSKSSFLDAIASRVGKSEASSAAAPAFQTVFRSTTSNRRLQTADDSLILCSTKGEAELVIRRILRLIRSDPDIKGTIVESGSLKGQNLYRGYYPEKYNFPDMIQTLPGQFKGRSAIDSISPIAENTFANEIAGFITDRMAKIRQQSITLRHEASQTLSGDITSKLTIHDNTYDIRRLISANKQLKDMLETFVKNDTLRSVEEFLQDNVNSLLLNGKLPKPKKLKTSVKTVNYTPKMPTLVKPLLTLTVDKADRLRLRVQGKYASVNSLLNFINGSIYPYVSKNMGKDGRLVYRTGRLARSVKAVDAILDGKQEAITVVMTYMHYPYKTFEPGGAMGSAVRDPRVLIRESVRELMLDSFIKRWRLNVRHS